MELDDERAKGESSGERALDSALEKLPRYAAPAALKQRLEAGWPAPPRTSPVASHWTRRSGTLWRAGALSLAAASLAVVATTFVVDDRHRIESLETEALNDHLRVLEGAPLAQVTGGLHEVKPWFGGRLDFAPRVRFAGSPEFPLQGGAVEPYLDRRAAVFVYKRRLHTASLFVARADGLGFPSRLRTFTLRGFNVALWSAGGQGFALVSDLELAELLELQEQIAAP
jgi:anti-sigma factor RsiW